MRALILKGRGMGREVEVSQWCNDWFTLEGYVQPFSPTSLAFTPLGMKEIKEHKNNGMLFVEFEWVLIKGKDIYCLTFKRIIKRARPILL